MKKVYEDFAIGTLFRRSSDEVAKYLLSHNLSPALIAECKTQLPDEKLLRAETYALLVRQEEGV